MRDKVDSLKEINMLAKLLWSLFLIALILIFTSNASAEMASENYRINSNVQSAGGLPAVSANYRTNSTTGQPSPLMDPLEPPISDTFDLYPGFWYAVMGPKCESDYDGDGDVDGSDLADYLFDPGGLDLDVFAADFGKANCP